MSDVESVHALLAAEEVDQAILDLRRHGVHADEIRIEPAPAGRWMLRDEELHEDAIGARDGARTGLLVGLFVGGIIVAVASSFGDTSGTAWLLAVIGMGGFGALVGAMTGLQLRDAGDDDPVRFREVAENSGLWALSVDSPRWSFRAHKILERHAAQFVEYETPAVPI